MDNLIIEQHQGYKRFISKPDVNCNLSIDITDDGVIKDAQFISKECQHELEKIRKMIINTDANYMAHYLIDHKPFYLSNEISRMIIIGLRYS